MNAFQPNPWYIEMSWHMFSAIWRSPHALSNIAKVKPFNTLSHHILLHLNKTNPPSAREAMTKNQDVFIFKATNNMFSPLVKKKQEKPKSHLLDHNLTSQHRLTFMLLWTLSLSLKPTTTYTDSLSCTADTCLYGPHYILLTKLWRYYLTDIFDIVWNFLLVVLIKKSWGWAT